MLFTSIFVTSSGIDVIFNAIAVLVLDVFIDSSFNHTRYFAVFFFSALLGNAMTLLMGPDYGPSAGASGGIFGLFAATFAYKWAEEKRIDRSTLFIFLAIFSSSSFLPDVNWMAHLGGSIGGFIAGPLLYYMLKNKLERYESISDSLLSSKIIVLSLILLMVVGSTVQFFYFVR
jgi:rhomboid protease GluP